MHTHHLIIVHLLLVLCSAFAFWLHLVLACFSSFLSFVLLYIYICVYLLLACWYPRDVPVGPFLLAEVRPPTIVGGIVTCTRRWGFGNPQLQTRIRTRSGSSAFSAPAPSTFFGGSVYELLISLSCSLSKWDGKSVRSSHGTLSDRESPKSWATLACSSISPWRPRSPFRAW